MTTKTGHFPPTPSARYAGSNHAVDRVTTLRRPTLHLRVHAEVQRETTVVMALRIVRLGGGPPSAEGPPEDNSQVAAQARPVGDPNTPSMTGMLAPTPNT